MAAQVWQRLGDPSVYVEPFAGSLAVLLHRGVACPREIVADTNGFICNFWRALRADPLGVAWWADYPTIHHDLAARHRWLLAWAEAHSPKLMEDATYYDTQVAGWWVWGLSNWVGGEWCVLADPREKRPRVGARSGAGVSAQRIGAEGRDRQPHISPTGGGSGVSAQRVEDFRPYVCKTSGGRGVSAQRDQVPKISSEIGGQGVQAQRAMFPLEGMPNGARLLDWFYALAGRLARVVVLNRSWESAVTPTLMQHTPTSPKPPAAVFMDPPYLTGDRKKGMYNSDRDDDPDRAARDSYEWAVAHGETYRIAYCAHSVDFPLPRGWTAIEETMGGVRKRERRHKRDAVYFSPACEGSDQLALFDAP